MSTPEEKQELYVAKQIRAAERAPKHKDIAEAENGSMVNDMEDLIHLGEDMEELAVKPEELNDGFKPDPLE